jgi:hypothetical protein
LVRQKLKFLNNSIAYTVPKSGVGLSIGVSFVLSSCAKSDLAASAAITRSKTVSFVISRSSTSKIFRRNTPALVPFFNQSRRRALAAVAAHEFSYTPSGFARSWAEAQYGLMIAMATSL